MPPLTRHCTAECSFYYSAIIIAVPRHIINAVERSDSHSRPETTNTLISPRETCRVHTVQTAVYFSNEMQKNRINRHFLAKIFY